MTIVVTDQERLAMLAEMCRLRHYNFTRPCFVCQQADRKPKMK